MKTIRTKILSAFACLLPFLLQTPTQAEEAPNKDSIGIIIIVDSSGSMTENTVNEWGDKEQRYSVANRALTRIVTKIDEFAKDRNVQVSLVTFSQTPVPLQKWNKDLFLNWIKTNKSPRDNTPLGTTIMTAAQKLGAATFAHKHIVALTDGQSNSGSDPDAVLREMKKTEKTSPIKTHIVAFDTNERTFKAVKEAGANVISADGATLETNMTKLFGEKILLEDPDER